MSALALAKQVKKSELQCPLCGSEALYRNGHAWTGKQRWVCLICRRQFSLGVERPVVRKRPTCPECRKAMYVYKRETDVTRFRCSGYPRCRTYAVITGGK